MSDTSPHSNIISKKLSRCSNHCALLVFSQTAYSQTTASQNFSSFLKKFLQSEKMRMVARGIPNLVLQISYFHRGGMEQIFHVQLVLLYLCMRVIKANWPGSLSDKDSPRHAATDNLIMLQIINNSALAKINSMIPILREVFLFSRTVSNWLEILHSQQIDTFLIHF